MAGRQRDELLATAIVKRVLNHKKRGRPLFGGDLEGLINFSRGSGAENIDLSPDHACRFLQLAQLEISSRISWVDQHTNRRGSWNKFVQKLQTLGLQFGPEKSHAREVAAGPIEAGDEAARHRIAGADKHNRNLCGCSLGYRRRWGIGRDHRDFTTYEIGSQYPDAIVLTPRPLVIHRDISTVDVTGFIQPLEEAGRVRRVSVW